MAVEVAHDLNIFSVLAHAAKPVSLSELAASKADDPQLVGKWHLAQCRQLCG